MTAPERKDFDRSVDRLLTSTEITLGDIEEVAKVGTIEVDAHNRTDY